MKNFLSILDRMQRAKNPSHATIPLRSILDISPAIGNLAYAELSENCESNRMIGVQSLNITLFLFGS
jgi:hypothetical protein